MNLDLRHFDEALGLEIHGCLFNLTGHAMAVTATKYSESKYVFLVASDLQGCGQVAWRLDRWPTAADVDNIAEELYQQPEQ